MRWVTSVSATGSTCTGSVGVMSVVLTQVTGLESAVGSAGMGCANRVGVELLGVGFANAMQTGSGLTGLGSTDTFANVVWTGMCAVGAWSAGTGVVGRYTTGVHGHAFEALIEMAGAHVGLYSVMVYPVAEVVRVVGALVGLAGAASVDAA